VFLLVFVCERDFRISKL